MQAGLLCFAATISWLIPVPLSRFKFGILLILSDLISFGLISSRFISFHPISFHFTSSDPIYSLFISHLISSNLISSNFISCLVFSLFFRIISSHILSRRLSSSQPTPALLSWSQSFSALLMSSQLTSPCLTHLIWSHWGSSPGACVRFLQFFFFAVWFLCCENSLLGGFFAWEQHWCSHSNTICKWQVAEANRITLARQKLLLAKT